MTTMLRRASVLAAAGALLLAASGCSVGGGGGPSAASPSTTASTSSIPTATVEVTPPGTRLAFGDTASIQLTRNQRSGVVALTVVAITPGTHEDAVALGVSNGEAYFATLRVQNTAAPPDLGFYVPDVIGLQSDGLQAANVSEPPDFPHCPDNGPVALPIGSSFLTCEAFVAVEGVPVTGVGFAPAVGDDPIVWQ